MRNNFKQWESIISLKVSWSKNKKVYFWQPHRHESQTFLKSDPTCTKPGEASEQLCYPIPGDILYFLTKQMNSFVCMAPYQGGNIFSAQKLFLKREKLWKMMCRTSSLFILDANLEGQHVFGERLKEVHQTHLHACYGGSDHRFWSMLEFSGPKGNTQNPCRM